MKIHQVPDDAKVCPLCAEAIGTAAKVCPYCRHWQKNWSWKNPQVAAMLVCLSGLVMVICAGVFVEHLFSRGRSFASYQDQIAVIESHTSHRTSGSNLLVTVVGVITNRSEFGWKEVILEAQMFDEHGALIDVVTHSGAYAGVTIAPHGEAGFKIESKAAHQESRYAAHHVSVRWAKDINEWP